MGFFYVFCLLFFKTFKILIFCIACDYLIKKFPKFKALVLSVPDFCNKTIRQFRWFPLHYKCKTVKTLVSSLKQIMVCVTCVRLRPYPKTLRKEMSKKSNIFVCAEMLLNNFFF